MQQEDTGSLSKGEREEPLLTGDSCPACGLVHKLSSPPWATCPACPTSSMSPDLLPQPRRQADFNFLTCVPSTLSSLPYGSLVVSVLAGARCRPCPQGWMWSEGHCYYVSTEAEAWEASRAFCSAHHATLPLLNHTQVRRGTGGQERGVAIITHCRFLALQGISKI